MRQAVCNYKILKGPILMSRFAIRFVFHGEELEKVNPSPLIPANNSNICPNCSTSHFPFCPPPPFIQNPRFHHPQSQNDYYHQRPRFDFTGSKITLERHRFIEMEKERNEFEIEMARAKLRFTG
ncbi:hypothetical protein LXL04_016869 [Taraxacum kok-saghyz]